MTMPLRVLLLDDREADADLIARALNGAGPTAQIERVSTREELATTLAELQPDIVLSNTSSGAFDARQTLDVVRSVHPAAGVVILAPTFNEQTAVACLRAGAEDIVLLSNLGRLRASVDAAIETRRPLTRLSPRQLQVMRLVAEGNTTPQIAQRLKLSGKTIETHRGELMKRLGIHDVVRLVRYAVRVGLVASDAATD
jgi:DNA-binding NarL/FixJ family response regulator